MKKITVVFLLVVITGCAATPLNSSSQRVRITNSEPSRECTFLGDVTGSQGGAVSGFWTANEDLETGARNDIKNKAAALGGNVISILHHQAGETKNHQTDVTISGNVYRCPE